MERFEIDATNQTLGRLATKAATMLRGKHLAKFEPHKDPNVEVSISNLDKVRFTGDKYNQKVYYRYSGYHGGIRARSLKELWESRPQYVMQGMIYRMLPKNRMRDKIIKRLKFN